MKQIRRQVVSVEFAPSQLQKGKWQGSNVFTLECGHTASAKQSAGVPKIKSCYQCEDLATGSIYRRKTEDGWIKETWNKEKSWPVREVIEQPENWESE